MWPYWLIFLIPAGAAIAYGWQSPSTRLHRSSFKLGAGWLFLIVVLSLFIGLRHQVGGDWGAYLRHLDSQIGRGISDVLAGGDPGYYLLNWLAVHGGANIYAVNLVCGLIGAIGLVAFSRTQPRPLLAIAIATPYLVNIVMMGYTRQGAAIGLGMLGLAALVKARNRQFVFWVLAAITFHKSAIVLLPLAILGKRKNRWLTGLAAIVITAMAYHFFLADYLWSLYAGYIRAEYN